MKKSRNAWASLFVASGTIATVAAADGIVDGSFDRGSASSWTKRDYGACPDVRFTTEIVDVDALDSDRRAFLSMSLDLPEFLEHVQGTPSVRQDGIVLDPCLATDFVVLRFDHRITTEISTAFPGLLVVVVAHHPGESLQWETRSLLVAVPEGRPGAGDWLTAEVILELPTDVAPEELEYSIEFGLGSHSVDAPGQKDCAVVYAKASIDQVVLDYGSHRGDAPVLNRDGLCGLNESVLGLCDDGAPREPIGTRLQNGGEASRNWRHWDRDPALSIRCQPSSQNQVDCLVDFPVLDATYARATIVSPSDCKADLDNDGLVDGRDLALLLSRWGSVEVCYDLSGNGVVDGADLAVLLGTWNCS